MRAAGWGKKSRVLLRSRPLQWCGAKRDHQSPCRWPISFVLADVMSRHLRRKGARPAQQRFPPPPLLVTSVNNRDLTRRHVLQAPTTLTSICPPPPPKFLPVIGSYFSLSGFSSSSQFGANLMEEGGAAHVASCPSLRDHLSRTYWEKQRCIQEPVWEKVRLAFPSSTFSY